jgi:hypothetical protein
MKEMNLFSNILMSVVSVAFQKRTLLIIAIQPVQQVEVALMVVSSVIMVAAALPAVTGILQIIVSLLVE